MTDNPGDAAHSPLRAILRLAWAVYALIAFIVCALAALVCALALPGLERRRRWVTRFARWPFVLAGIDTRIDGEERLPQTQCVVVANHASYLDGIVLQAFLPPRFAYVIKGEMQRVPVIGLLLRRIGSRFVDRHTPGRSARDARGLLRAAESGESLAFFPEGTFTAEVGLSGFRLGAFAAARRAGLPVVPVVIRGTRHILPTGYLLPRRGPMRIDILDPLDPAAADGSRELAARTRRRILAVLGEPDLAAAPDC